MVTRIKFIICTVSGLSKSISFVTNWRAWNGDFRVGATTGLLRSPTVHHVEQVYSKYKLDRKIQYDKNDDSGDTKSASATSNREVDAPAAAPAGKTKSSTGPRRAAKSALPSLVFNISTWPFIIKSHIFSPVTFELWIYEGQPSFSSTR
jgi:hypothetical protein